MAEQQPYQVFCPCQGEFLGGLAIFGESVRNGVPAAETHTCPDARQEGKKHLPIRLGHRCRVSDEGEKRVQNPNI